MTDPNRYLVYFTLSGDFDPSEVTALLRLQPSEAWKAGDRNEQTHHERKFSRWSLHSRLNEHASFEDQIADVLEQLEPGLDAILDAKAKYKIYLQLVGYFHRSYPGLHFTEGIIAGLARFGLAIDFDFYYLYSDDREDS